MTLLQERSETSQQRATTRATRGTKLLGRGARRTLGGTCGAAVCLGGAQTATSLSFFVLIRTSGALGGRRQSRGRDKASSRCDAARLLAFQA